MLEYLHPQVPYDVLIYVGNEIYLAEREYSFEEVESHCRSYKKVELGKAPFADSLRKLSDHGDDGYVRGRKD